MPGETLTRRNLPHWFMPNAMHFVTFRLAGTLPVEVLNRLKSCKADLLRRRTAGETQSQHRERVHKQLFAEYDRYLDRNRDVHWLDDPRIAALVRRSLYHCDGKKFRLANWCIMPNHVHILIQPLDFSPIDGERVSQGCGESEDRNSPLSEAMHSLKSYTAHEANLILGRTGGFWQHESYDHWVRDAEELERIVMYINANPVESGLAHRPHEYPWCSAHDRYLYDGDTSGWLSSSVILKP